MRGKQLENGGFSQANIRSSRESNITYLTHCATRLRFNVKDEASVDLKALDRLEGVLKAQFRSGQLQIIIGAKVKAVFDALSEMIDLDKSDIEVKEVKQKKNVISRIVETVAGIFGPVIPVLIGCGMVKSVLAILTSMGLIETTSGAYQVFNLISDLIFTSFRSSLRSVQLRSLKPVSI